MTVTGVGGALLAGCSLPDGIDGDLTDGWASFAAPTGWAPEAGVCHDQAYQETIPLTDYAPVDCEPEHGTETVYVGEFTGAAAERVTPPEQATEEWRAAYAECDEGATDYLGANFRHARLWLGVAIPTTQAWDGGSRWFRCDVEPLGGGSQPTREGSLAGALSGDDSELALGCFEVTLANDDTIERMDPVGCDEPHQAEFVGVWRAEGDDYLDGAEQRSANQVHAGCRSQVAEYVDVPDDDNLEFRTGTIADWMDEQDWDNGDRGFRCYLWLNGNDLDESLEGAGTSGLPIQ